MRLRALRKSITDLTRRRSRTVFAVATLALAVASIGFFAMPALMDRSMQAEVASGKLADLTVSTRPLVLDDARLGGARARCPNVHGGRAALVLRRARLRRRAAGAGLRRSACRDFAAPARRRRPCRLGRGAAAAARCSPTPRTRNQGLLRRRRRRHRQDHRRRRLGPAAARSAARARNLDGGQDVTGRRRRRPLRDAGDRRRAQRRARLQLARLPARRHERRPRSPRRSRRARATLRGVPGLLGLHRSCPTCAPPATGPARRTSTAFCDFFYVITRAGAAVGARADREHDDDARRRADGARSG